MGMFSKDAETANSATGETRIGPSVKIEGSFVSGENVHLEGEVIGELKIKGSLVVAQSAKIRANVEAADMTVMGEIHGNITCRGKLDLKSKGKIFGDVSAGLIAIEEGAVMQGKCNVGQKSDTETSENHATHPKK